MATARQPALRRALSALAGLALTGAVLAGCGSTATPTAREAAEPGHNVADVAFAAEMVPHHEEGLQLVAMAAGRDVTLAFAELTGRIGAEQSADIDQLDAWLDGWDATASPGRDHLLDRGLMVQRSTTDTVRGLMRNQMGPWALSADDLDRLGESRPPDFEDRWLRTMITHHEGAISMARHEIAQGAYPPAIALAEEIVTTQQAEVEQMEALLRS
jgi:uncharacterized protein (DUF305 family)